MTNVFSDVFYSSPDGLRLHARDYNVAPSGAVTVLCMPGLTRNVRDFDGLAARLAPTCRVIVAEQRGRGQSAYDPKPENYHPLTYVNDMIALLDHLSLAKVAIIGTSLGGLMGMMMCAGWPDRFSGLFINDVGPEFIPGGIEKIQKYIDRVPAITSWDDASKEVATLFATVFPGYGVADWEKFARAVYRDSETGVPVLDYDRAIAVNVKAGAIAPDLWPVFDGVPPLPMAVLRAQLSDLLSEATVAEMVKRRPDLMIGLVPNVGHAPNLEEPEAIALVDRFLAAIAGK